MFNIKEIVLISSQQVHLLYPYALNTVKWLVKWQRDLKIARSLRYSLAEIKLVDK